MTVGGISDAPSQTRRWKGFADRELEAFSIRRGAVGMEVPYFTRSGKHYRTKLFPWSGEPRSRWLGPSKPQIPYGLWRAPREGDAIVLTEGESDTIAFTLAFPKVPVLGLPGSQSWKSEWWSLVADFKRVYLCFDGDNAGRELTEKVKADLPEYRVVNLPEGADLRALLQLLGRDPFKVLIETADRGWEQRMIWGSLEAAVQRRRQLVEIPWEQRAQ